jgi:hypothetical protein
VYWAWVATIVLMTGSDRWNAGYLGLS